MIFERVSGLWRDLREKIFRRVDQYTWIWCSNGHEMIASGSWQSTAMDGLEVFECKVCGEWSEWNFDPPAPIRIDGRTY